MEEQNNRYHQQRQIFDVKSISNDKRLNEMSKERKKQIKSENLIMEQMNRKKELAKACLTDEKGSDSVELSSILGNQINNAFSNLIHLEKQQMGLSIPKYKNSATGIIFAQLPKQNGVNTVMIDTADDTGLSIKRGITNGKILEKQESFIAGKPVTLELWNPIIYGKNLFLHNF
ncbi:hypothetical protein WUBG_13532 [Wuchereria bancrofti]|uniref:Uncharacterized protein n=1 Tax=Wuchereria bancrofti TaxID=6293 RepID=J9E0C8_WUCBA|nr:hypothetical protein WUBG_13532 [Wuchereria bancrofti]